MKKSTLFLVAAALTLAIVTLLVTRTGDEPTIKKLDIAGYATPEQLEREQNRGLMDAAEPIAHPIDEIILERPAANGGQGGPAERIRIVRDGEGDKLAWKLVEPIEAPAVKWSVDPIVELFKSNTTRSDARAIKPADFPLFDFEDSRRIGLTLKSRGAVWNGVDLVIGQVMRESSIEAEGRTVRGTWVMVRGDESTAFLLAEKDLRTPVDKTLAELRDKKVFSFEADAISKIEISPPTGETIVLSATTTEEPLPPDAAPDATPKKTTTWALTAPAGVVADSGVASVSRSLANLRVNDFVALDKATDEAKKALEGPTWKLAFRVGEASQTLVIEASDKDPVWARLDGKDELMSLSSFTAKNLQKGLDELKNKTVWDIAQADITGLTLKSDEGPLTLARDGETWRFTRPALPFEADPSSLLSGLAKLAASRWARPDEVEAARAMLANPEIQGAVQTSSQSLSVTISVILPSSDGAQNRWAALGDPASAEPFLLSDFNAKRFVSAPASLRSKRLLQHLRDQTVAITVTSPGGEAMRFEKAPAGSDFALTGLAEGESQNDEAVRTLTSSLFAMDARSFHDGKAATETGLSPASATSVTLALADGKTVTLLISSTSAGDGELFALASEGPQRNTPIGVNEYQAKNIAKPRADLIKPAAP